MGADERPYAADHEHGANHQVTVDEGMRRMADAVGPGRLWVNPGCGLKTRSYDEITEALAHMAAATHTTHTTHTTHAVRAELGSSAPVSSSDRSRPGALR